jgi:hypothetical protein
MPAKAAHRTKGRRPLYVELPEELWERLDAIRRRSRRTITAEVSLALEHWLDQQEKSYKGAKR